jgi:hypothetical protein
MSNELIAAAALVGGIALGMNDRVRKGVLKAAGVTTAALGAGKDRFAQPEPDLIQATSVTRVPRSA